MALGIYAGDSINNMVLLPSPTALKLSEETIWSENTGRAQSGSNKAKMIGDVVAKKKTYDIKWEFLQSSEMTTIRHNISSEFFYFAAATSLASAKEKAEKYYRGPIQSEYLVNSDGYYYRDVSVQVIEQ